MNPPLQKKNIFWFYKAQKAAWVFTVERLSYVVPLSLALRCPSVEVHT